MPPLTHADAIATEDGEPEMSRWPKAPYVLAAAIAVVLVTVFTLYGLLHGSTPQQQQSAPATAAEVIPSGHGH